MVTCGAILKINDTELPFPLVEGAESVEELLLPMETEIADLLGAVLTLEAVELLALNLEGIADAGIPAEHSVKDVITSVRYNVSGMATRRMTMG
jgi:hypothetical protein